MTAEQKRGADGVKIAVSRKGRANAQLMRAAAHAQRSIHLNLPFITHHL